MYICVFMTFFTSYSLCDTLMDPWKVRIYVHMYICMYVCNYVCMYVLIVAYKVQFTSQRLQSQTFLTLLRSMSLQISSIYGIQSRKASPFLFYGHSTSARRNKLLPCHITSERTPAIFTDSGFVGTKAKLSEVSSTRSDKLLNS